MMLSDLHKDRLAKILQQARERFSEEEILATGPVGIVEACAQSCEASEHPIARDNAANLRDNQEEAKQYVAGILGLM